MEKQDPVDRGGTGEPEGAPRESGPAPRISRSALPPSGTHRRRAVVQALETPAPARVLSTVLRLSRQLGVEMHDEDIVHAFVEAMKTLFTGRQFVIRLRDAESGTTTLVYATGRLLAERRDSDEITAAAVEQHDVRPEVFEAQGISVVRDYRPTFTPGGHGFDVPLMDGERVFGLLSVEYPAGVEQPPDDRATVGQMTLQLGSALRNARLLRESLYLRDYLSKLLDHANAPIVVIGRHREIRVVNRAFLRLTGLEREEVLGEEFVQMLPETERTRLLPVFVNALRGRPTSDFEIAVPSAEGGVARLSMNVASFLSADGDVEGVIAIGRDLTEVRQLEEQVVQAEKLATLGQLAAGVVHELNNPLTSISVYSEYLLKKYSSADHDPGDVEKLRRIVHGTQRILRFTRDLVAYARPTTEAPSVLSIHEVLDQAAVFCEHVVEEAGARVDRHYDGPPAVLGVKGQLHQVFINLITNACHAMPEGAGRLEIRTTSEDEDHVTVRIKDNGAGIRPDLQERVFEPFFSTKGEGKGTGLGLSIVRNILHQFGATIHVESEIGEGTTMVVRLPCPPPGD